MKKGYNENELATVKGLQGYRHGTLNIWGDNGGLITLCGRNISPNYRSLALSSINCLKCKGIIRSAKPSVSDSVRSGEGEG